MASLLTLVISGSDYLGRHQRVHPRDQALPPIAPDRMRNVLPLSHCLPSPSRRTHRTASHARLGLGLLGQAHANLQRRRLFLHLPVRRNCRHVERAPVLQVSWRPHHGHHQHRGVNHLQGDPLRGAHQRWAGNWSGLDEGLHVPDPVSDDVCSGSVS